MQDLVLGKDTITSFYDLLGVKEDSMTYGLGYVLSRSPTLVRCTLDQFGHRNVDPQLCKVLLQRHESRDKGFSDIEIWYREKRLLIIEAKKGWILPSQGQLGKYKSRFRENDFTPSIGVLSECSVEYAKRHLDRQYPYVSWKALYTLLQKAYKEAKSTIEKNHLQEYSTYLSKLTSMDREQSNLTYCVSLSRTKVPNSEVSFLDVVYKYNCYFYPYSSKSGWPLEAPNYIAFRFDGRLQSIHKVEAFTVNDNLHQSMPEVFSDTSPDVHFFLQLGPAIKPGKVVKNGSIWPNGRYWCMIDTLLTCNTVEEARDISKERLQGSPLV